MSYFGTIYADTELPSRAKAVYMYLRDRSDAEGKCWPGIKTIASDMKLSRSCLLYTSPTRFLTITRLTQQTYRRTQTMRKRSAEEKQKQLERFLMNVAEAADAALWEYWREKEAEHRRFATEYVTRRGLIPQQ